MKKLVVFAFAVSSLLRPSPTLCVGALGNVRVGYCGITCCVPTDAPPHARQANCSTAYCLGCQNAPLLTHALSSKRVNDDASHVPLTYVLLGAPADAHNIRGEVPAQRDAIAAKALLVRALSTTVIRR